MKYLSHPIVRGLLPPPGVSPRIRNTVVGLGAVSMAVAMSPRTSDLPFMFFLILVLSLSFGAAAFLLVGRYDRLTSRPISKTGFQKCMMVGVAELLLGTLLTIVFFFIVGNIPRYDDEYLGWTLIFTYLGAREVLSHPGSMLWLATIVGLRYFVLLAVKQRTFVPAKVLVAAFVLSASSTVAISGREDYTRCTSDSDCTICIDVVRSRNEPNFDAVNKRYVTQWSRMTKGLIASGGESSEVVRYVERHVSQDSKRCQNSVKQAAGCERGKCLVVDHDFRDECGLTELFNPTIESEEPKSTPRPEPVKIFCRLERTDDTGRTAVLAERETAFTADEQLVKDVTRKMRIRGDGIEAKAQFATAVKESIPRLEYTIESQDRYAAEQSTIHTSSGHVDQFDKERLTRLREKGIAPISSFLAYRRTSAEGVFDFQLNCEIAAHAAPGGN